MNFVRIPTIGPEENDAVKDGLDVGNAIIAAFGKYPEEATVTPNVPVLVQVVDGRDAAAVAVRVVHVFDVVRAGAGVACDHCLEKKESGLELLEVRFAEIW